MTTITTKLTTSADEDHVQTQTFIWFYKISMSWKYFYTKRLKRSIFLILVEHKVKSRWRLLLHQKWKEQPCNNSNAVWFTCGKKLPNILWMWAVMRICGYRGQLAMSALCNVTDYRSLDGAESSSPPTDQELWEIKNWGGWRGSSSSTSLRGKCGFKLQHTWSCRSLRYDIMSSRLHHGL